MPSPAPSGGERQAGLMTSPTKSGVAGGGGGGGVHLMPQRDHATPHTRSGEHAKQGLLFARSNASPGKGGTGWATSRGEAITPESGGPPIVSSPGDATMAGSVSAELAPPGNDSIDSVNPGIRDDDDEEEDFGQGEEYVFDEGTGEWAKRRRALSPKTRQREMIFREREEALKRVEGALIKSEELLLTDLDDEAEVEKELRKHVMDMMRGNAELLIGREQSSAELGQWFRVQTDSAKSFSTNTKENTPAVDIDEFSVSVADNIIHHMKMLREKVSDISHTMMHNGMAAANSEQWETRIAEERKQADEEMTKMVATLERVQRFADDNSQMAMELREKLAKTQEEKNLWHRRYEELETKEQSLFAQMEETISQRTDVLNENVTNQTKEAEQRVTELIDINEVQRNEATELKQLLREREVELVRVRADVSLGVDKINVLTEELKRVKNMAGPTADTLGRMRAEMEERNRRIAELQGELHLQRKSGIEENDEIARQLHSTKKAVAERDETIRGLQEKQATMMADTLSELAQLKGKLQNEEGRSAQAEETAQKLRQSNEELRMLVAASDAKINEAKQSAQKEVEEAQATAKEELARAQELQSSVAMARTESGQQEAIYHGKVQELEKQVLELKATVAEQQEQLTSQDEAILRTESEKSALVEVKRQPLLVEKTVEKEVEVEKVVEVPTYMDGEKEKRFEQLLDKVEALAAARKTQGQIPTIAGRASSSPGPSHHDVLDRIMDAVSCVDNEVSLMAVSGLHSESERMSLESRGTSARPGTMLPSEKIRGLLRSVWKFREMIIKDVFSKAAEIGIKSPRKTANSDWLGDKIGTIGTVEEGQDFVNTVLDGLLEFLTESWQTSGVHEMAHVVHEGLRIEKELVSEAEEAQDAVEDIQKRIRTAKSGRSQTAGGNSHFDEFLHDMENRDAEARARWNSKVKEIKEHRANHILRCMDAFVKVVDLNFKLQLRPGVLQDVKAMMYTSLVSRADRANLESGGPRQVEYDIMHPDKDKSHRTGPIVHYDSRVSSPQQQAGERHDIVAVTGHKIVGDEANSPRQAQVSEDKTPHPPLGVSSDPELSVGLTGHSLGGNSTVATGYGLAHARQYNVKHVNTVLISPPRGLKGHPTPKSGSQSARGPDRSNLNLIMRNQAATLAPRNHLANDDRDEVTTPWQTSDRRAPPQKPRTAERHPHEELGHAKPPPMSPNTMAKVTPPIDWGGPPSGRKNSPSDRYRPMGPVARGLKPPAPTDKPGAPSGSRPVPPVNLPALPMLGQELPQLSGRGRA